MLVGERIRTVRDRRGLTIRAAAAKAEMREETWGRVEAGREPRSPTLARMAHALDVSVEELRDGRPAPAGATEAVHPSQALGGPVAAIVALVSALPPEGQRRAATLLFERMVDGDFVDAMNRAAIGA